MARFDESASPSSFSTTLSSISSSQFSTNQSYFSDETTQNSRITQKSKRSSSHYSSIIASTSNKASSHSESLYETGSETVVESEIITKFDNASKFELPKSIVDSTKILTATEFETKSRLDSDTSLLESTSIYSASSYKPSVQESSKQHLYDDRKNYWKCRTWIIKTSTICVRVQLPAAGKAFRVRFRNK